MHLCIPNEYWPSAVLLAKRASIIVEFGANEFGMYNISKEYINKIEILSA